MSKKQSLRRPVARAAGWLAITGTAVGILIGFVVAGGLTATGITSANLPPLPQQETSATPTPKPTPTPTPEPTEEGPQPELETDSDRVPPGQRFRLRGQLPGVEAGQPLQVQVRDGNGPWDDFPVSTPARADGAFETTIYTSRTGERQFRLIHKASNETTPVLTVTIG